LQGLAFGNVSVFETPHVVCLCSFVCVVAVCCTVGVLVLRLTCVAKEHPDVLLNAALDNAKKGGKLQPEFDPNTDGDDKKSN